MVKKLEGTECSRVRGSSFQSTRKQALIGSYNTRQPVTLVVFSPFDDEELTGVITSTNTGRREVKLFRGEDDFSWIKLEDIISAKYIKKAPR